MLTSLGVAYIWELLIGWRGVEIPKELLIIGVYLYIGVAYRWGRGLIVFVHLELVLSPRVALALTGLTTRTLSHTHPLTDL